MASSSRTRRRRASRSTSIPTTTAIVKVHYDLSAWSFDHRAELAEALADADIPHYWDDDELVVPEVVEQTADAMFERLEAELGPFPVGLGRGRRVGRVRPGRVERHRPIDARPRRSSRPRSRIDGTGPTIPVAADAEEDVDALLDAIEAGELGPVDDGGVNEPPEGALSDIFLAANKLAKDPFDAKARLQIIDLDGVIHPKHPPYALASAGLDAGRRCRGEIVRRIEADADGGEVDDAPVGDDGQLQESSDVIGLAQALRSIVRDYV